MAKDRVILELVLAGRSDSEIVAVAGCSRRDVSRVRQAVTERGLSSAAAVSDAELAEWFPDGRRRVSQEYEQPDLARVLASMRAGRHFTLLLGWRRYADGDAAGMKKSGYSQFCALFADYVRSNDLVATLHHEPGRAMLVDWAGDTIDLVDALTGRITPAVLFVAVLPFSGALFCRAYLNMKSESWLDAHVRAFALYGGVVTLVVYENVPRNILVPDAMRNAAECGECLVVSVEEGLLGLGRIDAVHRSSRARQAHREHEALGERALEGEVDLAEVDLGLGAGLVQLRDRDDLRQIPHLPATLADVGAHRRLSKVRLVLVDEALEDTPGCVALLRRCGLVLLEDLVDRRLVGPERRCSALGHLAGRRDRRGQGLAHHAAMHVVLRRERANRQAKVAVITSYRFEQLHPRHLLPPLLRRCRDHAT